jgi:hypothetical protein
MPASVYNYTNPYHPFVAHIRDETLYGSHLRSRHAPRR